MEPDLAARGRRALLDAGRRYGRLVARSDLAIGYTAIVVVLAVVLALGPQHFHDAVVQQCSTNLDNLRLHPVWVLGASLFVVTSVPGLWQILIILGVYAAAQRWVGRSATVFVALVGHVGATLLVAVMLASGIARGRVSDDVRHATDVGYSYALACTAAFVCSQVPARWRSYYVGFLVLDFGIPVLFSPSFTDVGHASALLIGFGLALVAAKVATAARSSDDGIADRDDDRTPRP